MTRRHLLGGARGEAAGDALSDVVDNATDNAAADVDDAAEDGMGDGNVNDICFRCGGGLPSGGGGMHTVDVIAAVAA